MMRIKSFFLGMLLFHTSIPADAMTRAADQQFEILAKKFIAEFLELYPETATAKGEHRYDDRLDDYSLEGLRKSRVLAKKYLAELQLIALDKLSHVNNVDARILREELGAILFQIDELREYEWNPLIYNPGQAINNLISRDFAPLTGRLLNAKARLKQIPQVVAAAKANLKNPPRIFTETAIAQNKGVIDLIKVEMQRFVEQANMKTELADARAKAIASLEEYGVWLEKELLPRSNGDFRIGEKKFREKLKFALSSEMSKEDILKRAESDLKDTQEKMFAVAQKLAPGLGQKDKKTVIKLVLDKLAQTRPNNDNIVSKASADLEKITQFVREKNLVTVPTEPVKVIVMPEFARGQSIAYFDSAGPFERKNEAWYAISPTPADWTTQRKDSFYKEYNDYMLQELTIHEAMPGHYLQTMHANHFKAPTSIRAVFRSGTFTEGWAVYAERLMAENGYGGPEVKMQQLKMRLRVITNAIIDQKIHTANMSEKEAMDLMMNEGFQEEGEASGKWKRAQLSSTQLSTYFVGSAEVSDIRTAYEAKKKTKVDLRQMHDQMLSFGSPPPKYVKELMGLN